MDEMQMAIMVAARTWRGTSLAEGAEAVLAQIYSPHAYQGEAKECSQCGKAKADPLHRFHR